MKEDVQLLMAGEADALWEEVPAFPYPPRGRLLGLQRVRIAIDTGDDSVVQQQFADEVDVNTIVRRFGLAEPPVVAQGVYGDFTGITDYESAVAAVETAQANFMRLPAAARDKFGNDPARFLDYAMRVGEDELIAFCGLVPAPAAPVPPLAAAPAPATVPVPDGTVSSSV